VDIVINAHEAATIATALETMEGFELRPTQVMQASESVNYAFHPNPVIHYAAYETPPRVHAVTELIGLTFTQGVNEMQTLANLSSSRDVPKQAEINLSSLARLRDYYNSYRIALQFQLLKSATFMADALQHTVDLDSMVARDSTIRPMRRKSTLVGTSLMSGHQSTTSVSTALSIKVSELTSKILSFNDRLVSFAVWVLWDLDLFFTGYLHRLLEQLQDAILVSHSTPYEKHVDVLTRSGAIGRQICGITSILCKSGKDRTSMGVTLTNTRSLVEDLGVHNGQDVCQLMRYQGVRRMNVYANTGQSMFAFNQIQRRALPACFRPPPGCHAGNIVT
jgi:hypothetical protein